MRRPRRTESEHELVYRRVIAAHQRVVDRWNRERWSELDDLSKVTEAHTEDALYRPFQMTYDLEESFYEDVDGEMEGVRVSSPSLGKSQE